MPAFTTRAQKARHRARRLNQDGWLYGGLPGLQWEVENARKADRKVMQSIRDDMEHHEAFHDYYHACINCGNCTAVCPAFRFTDFGPRIVVQKVMHSRDEPESALPDGRSVHLGVLPMLRMLGRLPGA